MAWRVARSLDQLLAQLNALAPKRSKVSDGSIGDTAHASRSSDHNPWYGPGIVTARDFTHDPAAGLDCHKLADALVRSGDKRIKYIIWNRRIWQGHWAPYSGVNPHTKHLHLSVVASASADNTAPWNLTGTAPAASQEDTLSAAYEKDDRARWPKADALERDLRGDLARKQKQIDQLVKDVAEIKAAVLPKKTA